MWDLVWIMVEHDRNKNVTKLNLSSTSPHQPNLSSASTLCCVLHVLCTSHTSCWVFLLLHVIFDLCVTFEVLSYLLSSVIGHNTASVWPKALPHPSRSRVWLHAPLLLLMVLWMTHRETDGTLTCLPYRSNMSGLIFALSWNSSFLGFLLCSAWYLYINCNHYNGNY